MILGTLMKTEMREEKHVKESERRSVSDVRVSDVRVSAVRAAKPPAAAPPRALSVQLHDARALGCARRARAGTAELMRARTCARARCRRRCCARHHSRAPKKAGPTPRATPRVRAQPGWLRVPGVPPSLRAPHAPPSPAPPSRARALATRHAAWAGRGEARAGAFRRGGSPARAPTLRRESPPHCTDALSAQRARSAHAWRTSRGAVRARAQAAVRGSQASLSSAEARCRGE